MPSPEALMIWVVVPSGSTLKTLLLSGPATNASPAASIATMQLPA